MDAAGAQLFTLQGRRIRRADARDLRGVGAGEVGTDISDTTCLGSAAVAHAGCHAAASRCVDPGACHGRARYPGTIAPGGQDVGDQVAKAAVREVRGVEDHLVLVGVGRVEQRADGLEIVGQDEARAAAVRAEYHRDRQGRG